MVPRYHVYIGRILSLLRDAITEDDDDDDDDDDILDIYE